VSGGVVSGSSQIAGYESSKDENLRSCAPKLGTFHHEFATNGAPESFFALWVGLWGDCGHEA
jgi:hypothetical protein